MRGRFAHKLQAIRDVVFVRPEQVRPRLFGVAGLAGRWHGCMCQVRSNSDWGSGMALTKEQRARLELMASSSIVGADIKAALDAIAELEAEARVVAISAPES